MADKTLVRENLDDDSPVANPNTGMGIPEYDASTATSIRRKHYQERDTLEDAYAESDVVQKACSILANDAWGRGIVPEGEDARAVLARMAELDVEYNFHQALILARVFGGSSLVMDDGRPWHRPLNVIDQRNYRPGSLVGLALFTEYELFPDSTMVERRFGRPGFDQPTLYWLKNKQENDFVVHPDDYYPVHPSRVLRFNYQRNPPGGWRNAPPAGMISLERNAQGIFRERTRAYCGLSLLQSILHLVKKELTAQESAEQLLTAASVVELPVNNMEGLTPEALEKEAAKARLLQRTLSNWRVLMRPAGSSLQRSNINLQALPSVLQEHRERIAFALDINLPRFLGIDAPGMNGNISGDAATKRHSAKVDSYRRTEIDPNLMRLMQVLAIDLGRRRRGIQYEWPAYFERTPEEVALEQKSRLDSVSNFLQKTGEGSVFIDQEKARRVVDIVMDGIIESAEEESR